MMKIVKYLFLFVTVITLTMCKKRTTIRVKLLNPALNEYVANATVVLVERKGVGSGGIFGGGASCQEIATGITNQNGECFFDKEKLKISKNYYYYCAVKESWGIPQSYPCGGKTSNFLEVGKDQDWLMTDYADGYLQVQYNSLLNPSQPGDSLTIGIITTVYYDPIVNHTQGGGGVFGNWNFHDASNPPNYPPSFSSDPIKTRGGLKTVTIHKRKFNVVTDTVYNVKVYPNQTTTVQINW